jgi:hypothetical protein
MSFEDKFKQQIADFQRYGTYIYEYDEVGNVILNPTSKKFSQVYLALPILNYIYDNGKVKNFYDPTFTEFIPPTNDGNSVDVIGIQTKLSEAETRNAELNSRLDELTALNESNPSAAERQSTKQVILELRKELGQGRVDSDFSVDFPYTPIQKPEKISEDA